MSMTYEVSVSRCDVYDESKVKAAVEVSLKPLGGLGSVVKKGDKVLIKLNLLSSKKPEAAVTTHPTLVKVIIRMVQELGGIPVVGDSPGGNNTGNSYRTLLKVTGIQAVADETGCEIVDFDKDTMEITSDKAVAYKKLTIARAVKDADVIIALPKLKTHQLTYYTGAVKLLYGYIPGISKTEYHLHTGKDVDVFAGLLLDIHEMRKPDIVIMDAVIGMEGQGPGNGDPRQIGLIISSKSCTALDFVATSIVNMEPVSVPTVRLAAERKTGPRAIGEISVFGESVEAVKIRDFKKAETMNLSRIPPVVIDAVNRLMGSRPAIDRNKCKKCGICARDCPPKAISFEKGSVPQIHYGKCIRCYCCQELCPHNAVGIHVPLPRKIIAIVRK